MGEAKRRKSKEKYDSPKEKDLSKTSFTLMPFSIRQVFDLGTQVRAKRKR